MPFGHVLLLRATLMLCICLGCASRANAVELARGPTAAYASAMRTINPRLQQLQSRAYAQALLISARRARIDPALVMAVVTVESGWNTRARSIHGAEGLGQLKPATARNLGVDPWSARANLRGVATYLHRLLIFFKNSRHAMTSAIAGYNAGPHAVIDAGGIPNNGQTPRYVAKVMSAWHHFRSRLGRHPRVATIAAQFDATRAIEQRQAAYWGVH